MALTKPHLRPVVISLAVGRLYVILVSSLVDKGGNLGCQRSRKPWQITTTTTTTTTTTAEALKPRRSVHRQPFAPRHTASPYRNLTPVGIRASSVAFLWNPLHVRWLSVQVPWRLRGLPGPLLGLRWFSTGWSLAWPFLVPSLWFYHLSPCHAIMILPLLITIWIKLGMIFDTYLYFFLWYGRRRVFPRPSFLIGYKWQASFWSFSLPLDPVPMLTL